MAGFLYLREAFFKVLNHFKTLAPHLILLCHVKDSAINKDGKEVTELSIDLTGKTARLVAADADAIGYLTRVKNQCILSFSGGGDFIAEARPLHLRGKDIVLSEMNDDETITTYWDRVFLNEESQIKAA